MEEKIKAAIKIIANLGGNFNVNDWHRACVDIMDLGISYDSLLNYIQQDPNRSSLQDMEKGNPYVAANFIRNFIMFNENISFIREWSYLTQSYVRAVSNDN